jgi:hypothetical protein
MCVTVCTIALTSCLEAVGGAHGTTRRTVSDALASARQSADDETAAVVLAGVDGRLLHRGLGAAADREAVAGVLRRLVD